MSSTPRSDIQRDHVAKTHMDWVCLTADANVVSVDFARQLELELNEANKRIKQLEEGGEDATYPIEYRSRLRIWTEAKEVSQ